MTKVCKEMVTNRQVDVVMFVVASQELVTNLFYEKVGVCICEFFFYFSTKTYVVGTQKYRLNETVLLRTQNIY